MKRRAFSLAEILVVVGLFGLVLGAAVYLFGYGSQAMRRLTPQLAVQQAGRRAVVRLLQDLQESMEVMQPRPGATLAYAVVMDKLGVSRFYYQVKSAADPQTTDLWRHVDDPTLPPAEQDQRVFTGIKRLSFTCQTEGALSLNMQLAEGETTYALLTTVRLRNLASAEELW